MTILYDVMTQHPYSNSVAAVGSMAWFWVPYLQAVSTGAATILPVLSVIWLGVQIYSHFRKKK